MNSETAQERRVCAYFTLLGVGYLFPFSAMTQPVDYWQLQFPGRNVLFQLSATFMYANLLLLVALVFVPQKQQLSRRSLACRIYGGFAGQLLAMLLVPSLYFLRLAPHWNLALVLGLTAAMACATAFLDASVIAIATGFPRRAQESLQLGVGFSCWIGCLYRVLTKLVFPQTAQGILWSSLVYFYSGALTIAACMLAFALLLNNAYARRYLQEEHHKTEQAAKEDVEGEETAVDFGGTESLQQEEAPLLAEDTHSLAHTDCEVISIPSVSSSSVAKPPNHLDRVQLVRETLPNGLCITVLFLTTLAVWPALITELKPHSFPELGGESQWWPLLLLNGFALLDIAGRLMASRWRFGIQRHTIWIPVALRTLLLPILVCCVKGSPFISLLQNDVASVVVVALLGWTNGWCGSLVILLMSEGEQWSVQERRFLGTLSSFYLNVGLVLGASLGLGMESIVR